MLHGCVLALIAGIILLAVGVILFLQSSEYSEYTVVRQGFTNLDSGKYQQAVKDFKQAMEINPDSVPAYDGRALAYYKLGKYKRALENLEKCIRLDPNDGQSHNNLAWFLATCPEHK